MKQLLSNSYFWLTANHIFCKTLSSLNEGVMKMCQVCDLTCGAFVRSSLWSLKGPLIEKKIIKHKTDQRIIG